MAPNKINVFIVDDSLLYRNILSVFLHQDDSINVVGAEGDPFLALEAIKKIKPDVVILDIEMPKMNGIEFLKKLIPEFPVPVVVVTAMPIEAFEALEAGAVEFVKKPSAKGDNMKTFSEELRGVIKIASKAEVKKVRSLIINKPKVHNDELFSLIKDNHVIAIGASTGGTDAIKEVLEGLPKNAPPAVIVIHMPPKFTQMYAERLNRICKIDVKEAQDGDRLRPGLALVGAGGLHLRLVKDHRGYYVKCEAGEKVSGHCPSVDVLFSSVAEAAKEKAVGVILTGMGRDGADGLFRMKKAGAHTIGQDKESCVVYGMPMVAFNIGAVVKQSPLENISTEICAFLKEK
ncbi:MAG: chemotaxis-specific protein-glutamate methyltransferase CheB [Oscillospiraceae bacterium]|jgi:two-component system chemotaxis response regulator CheB